MCTYYCGSSGTSCPQGYDCRTTYVGGASGPAIEICRQVADGGTPVGTDAGLRDAGTDVLVAYFTDGGSVDAPLVQW